jgi:hypothetical protein
LISFSPLLLFVRLGAAFAGARARSADCERAAEWSFACASSGAIAANARARRDVRCAIGCGVQPEIFQRDAFATEGGGDGLR